MLKRTHAQSIAEYMIMVTVIVSTIAVMFPFIKRGTQSLIRVGADQLGRQENAEQDFNSESGYTNMMSSSANAVSQTDRYELNGQRWISISEESSSTTNSLTNMGFTKGD